MVNDPTQPKIPEQSGSIKKHIQKVSNRTLDAIGIEFLIIVIVGIAATLILNYFSILPLSQKFPKVFGFLPTKNPVTISSTANNVPSVKTDPNSLPAEFEEPPQYLFSCPIIKFCSELKQIYDKKDRVIKDLGFLYVDQGSPIQTIIDGTVTSVTEKDGIVTIVEESKEKDFEITYTFAGKKDASIKNKSSVKNYQILGTVEGEARALSDVTTQTYHMVFRIVDLRTNQIIPVKPVENANGLEFL